MRVGPFYVRVSLGSIPRPRLWRFFEEDHAEIELGLEASRCESLIAVGVATDLPAWLADVADRVLPR